MGHLFLSVSLISGVIATSALNASERFSKLWPSIIMIVGYSMAFYLLSLVLKTIPVGIAHAIWVGLGIVLIAIVGAVLFKQYPDVPAINGMILIVAGVVLINVFSTTVSH